MIGAKKGEGGEGFGDVDHARRGDRFDARRKGQLRAPDHRPVVDAVMAFEDRRVPFSHVRQRLALPPGRYVLSGRAKPDGLRTERGLVWSLTCASGGAPLGETQPLRGGGAWRPFGAVFEVPLRGCGGQWLTLRLPARIPAEQRIGGRVWFDALKITRQRAPQA